MNFLKKVHYFKNSKKSLRFCKMKMSKKFTILKTRKKVYVFVK